MFCSLVTQLGVVRTFSSCQVVWLKAQFCRGQGFSHWEGDEQAIWSSAWRQIYFVWTASSIANPRAFAFRDWPAHTWRKQCSSHSQRAQCLMKTISSFLNTTNIRMFNCSLRFLQSNKEGLEYRQHWVLCDTVQFWTLESMFLSWMNFELSCLANRFHCFRCFCIADFVF